MRDGDGGRYRGPSGAVEAGAVLCRRRCVWPQRAQVRAVRCVDERAGRSCSRGREHGVWLGCSTCSVSVSRAWGPSPFRLTGDTVIVFSAGTCSEARLVSQSIHQQARSYREFHRNRERRLPASWSDNQRTRWHGSQEAHSWTRPQQRQNTSREAGEKKSSGSSPEPKRREGVRRISGRARQPA